MSTQALKNPISPAFKQASVIKQPNKAASPFSLRLTVEERAYLDRKAGGKPLGAYIREQLLGDYADKRRASRKPKIDEQQLALVLAELGKSRLSSNLNQLAKSVNIGYLDVSRDVEQELKDACGAVLAMRELLITALGLKSENGE